MAKYFYITRLGLLVTSSLSMIGLTCAAATGPGAVGDGRTASGSGPVERAEGAAAADAGGGAAPRSPTELEVQKVRMDASAAFQKASAAANALTNGWGETVRQMKRMRENGQDIPERLIVQAREYYNRCYAADLELARLRNVAMRALIDMVLRSRPPYPN